jgi:hypothetical protein
MPRVLQLEGLFDVAPTVRSERRWRVELPLEGLDWSVGLVVGPSGSGKSTLARAVFGDALVGGYDWPADRAEVDGFPEGLSVKDVCAALSSVGSRPRRPGSGPSNASRPGRRGRGRVRRRASGRGRPADQSAGEMSDGPA